MKDQMKVFFSIPTNTHRYWQAMKDVVFWYGVVAFVFATVFTLKSH